MDIVTQEQSGAKHKRSPELDLKFYGFTSEDMDREYPIGEKKIAVYINSLNKNKFIKIYI